GAEGAQELNQALCVIDRLPVTGVDDFGVPDDATLRQSLWE
ncbi:MAG: hypothetical protein QOF81_1102, partial [Acidimicrobiaceae bacterium]|nr:hypothetical protein [Acidimicrobiaceae bacterium]